MIPEGVAESNDLILRIDQCLLSGFTSLDYAQQETLQMVGRVFSGTALHSKLQVYLRDLVGGVFQPEAFRVLAAARAALQGAQYDILSCHIKMMLGRCIDPQPFVAPLLTEQVPPLLDSVRHWLMDMAITGFSHLTPSMITAFGSILEQILANRDYSRTAALLTGFINELMVPPENIPLFRWCDLWTRAMLTTSMLAVPKPVEVVSGTLYPLGIARRQHAQVTSLVIYGVLETVSRTEFVTITQSAYKVDAIQDKQVWLLFPHLALLLESLSAGKMLVLQEMPYLAGGHLLWDATAATLGTSYKMMDAAQAYFAPQPTTSIQQWELPPEERHPVHIAEPVALTNCCISNGMVDANGLSFKLDERRIQGTEFSGSELEAADRLFGLIRYDAGEWLLQPLAASQAKGKPIFIGKESGKILKKPPKDNTVNILKERASRLLREKA